MNKYIKFLLITIVTSAISSCNNANKSNIQNIHLLYLDKTDSIPENSIKHDTIFHSRYSIPYTDSITSIFQDESVGIIEDQIITNRQYLFGNETVSVSFTNICADLYGLDSLNSVFIFPDESLGILAIDTYSPGTSSACGGACYCDILIYSYNNQGKLNKIASISFNSCLTQIYINDKLIKTNEYIENIYWNKSGNTLFFETLGNEIPYAFSTKTMEWELDL